MHDTQTEFGLEYQPVFLLVFFFFRYIKLKYHHLFDANNTGYTQFLKMLKVNYITQQMD